MTSKRTIADIMIIGMLRAHMITSLSPIPTMPSVNINKPKARFYMLYKIVKNRGKVWKKFPSDLSVTLLQLSHYVDVR